MTFACRFGLPIALVLGAAQVASAQASQGAAQESASSDIAQVAPSSVSVATDAGAGSALAYANKSVVELGGTLAFTHASKTNTFRIAPFLGYFLVDRVELALIPEFTIIDVSGNTDVTFGAVLEPSYHQPLSEHLFGFIGLGLGLRYAKDPGVDCVLRPKLGMDVMVGRSGVFKPALFLDIGTNDGVSQYGLEAGFTVLL